jgi:O-antigen/teichoic acid export membrane protein
MSRKARAASGFLTGIVQFVVQTALQIVLAPVVLKVAGKETLGAYAAVMQFLSYLNMLDFGFGISLERFMAQASGLQDGGRRFRSIFTTARSAALVSNSIFAVLTLIYTAYVGRLFHLSAPVAHQAVIALRVIACWAVLRTPLIAYNSALIATQDLSATNLIATAMNALRVLTALGLVLAGYGLFGLMISASLVELVGTLVYRTRFQRKYPHWMPGWGIPDKPLFREMLDFGIHAMLINIGATLVFSSGNVLAGIVQTAKGASVYYTTQMAAMMGYPVALRLCDSSLPAINELWGQGLKDRVVSALARVQKLTLMLTLPLAAGVLLFNRDLVLAWVGPGQYGGSGMTAALALICLVMGVEHIASLFCFTIGLVREQTVATLLEAAANIGLGLWLGRTIGLAGIPASLVIVITPYTLYLMKRLGRELNFSVPRLLIVSFLRPLPAVLIASGAGILVRYALVNHIPSTGYRFLLLFSECAVFSAVYFVGAYFMAMTGQDRQDVRGYIGRFTRALGKPMPASEME